MGLTSRLKTFICAILFFLSMSLFIDLFVNPVKTFFQENKLLEFIVWLVSTFILVELFHKQLPWVGD